MATGPQPNHTLRRDAQHVVDGLLNQGADALGLFHHTALGVALLVRRHIERDGIENPQRELGREGHHHTERPEGEDVGRHREIRKSQQRGHGRYAEDDRHGLFGAGHRDRDDRHPGAHGYLDEAAAAEPSELVAVGERFGGTLGPFGEVEDQLSLFLEQPVGVGGPGRDPAAPGPKRADDRHGPEEVVGQAVDGSPQLLLDAVHDHRGVGGYGPRMVGHEERAALVGNLLQSLPPGAEPFRVDGLVEGTGQRPKPFRSPPLVDVGEAEVLRRVASGGGCGSARRLWRASRRPSPRACPSPCHGSESRAPVPGESISGRGATRVAGPSCRPPRSVGAERAGPAAPPSAPFARPPHPDTGR